MNSAAPYLPCLAITARPCGPQLRTSRAALTKFGASVSSSSSSSLRIRQSTPLIVSTSAVARDVDPQVHRVHRDESRARCTARARRAAGRAGCSRGRGRRSACAAAESLGSKCSKTFRSVTCVSRVLRPEWYSPFQKKVFPPSMRSTSSVIVPRVRSASQRRVVEVLADRADHAHLVEERRGEREVGGGAAQHPVTRPGRGDDGVIGDGSDDSEAHAAARVAFGARCVRSSNRNSAGRRCCGSSTSPSRPAAPGRSLVDVTVAGVNFADTHQRRNEYLAASELPLVPGAEVAGVRRDTGERRRRAHRRQGRLRGGGGGARPITRSRSRTGWTTRRRSRCCCRA